MVKEPEKFSSGMERDVNHLHDRVDRVERSHEADRGIVVDLQVRVAQIEVKNPIGQDEFEPIKRLVWGFVGTVLAVVLVAVLAIVINKTGANISVKP